MRTKILHFLILNLVFFYNLIAMENDVGKEEIQPSPVADKKIGEEQLSAIPSQIIEANNGNPPSPQLSEKKNIESLDEKLENMHISDKVQLVNIDMKAPHAINLNRQRAENVPSLHKKASLSPYPSGGIRTLPHGKKPIQHFNQ